MSDTLNERMAEAVCRERCAEVGDPPCSEIGETLCNGCRGIARAALRVALEPADAMVKRMARAMCALNGHDPDELARNYMMDKGRVQAGDPPRRWEDWKDDARAALDAALKEDPQP